MNVKIVFLKEYYNYFNFYFIIFYDEKVDMLFIDLFFLNYDIILKIIIDWFGIILVCKVKCVFSLKYEIIVWYMIWKGVYMLLI